MIDLQHFTQSETWCVFDEIAFKIVDSYKRSTPLSQKELDEHSGFFDFVRTPLRREVWAIWGSGDEEHLLVGREVFRTAELEISHTENVLFYDLVLRNRGTAKEKRLRTLKSYLFDPRTWIDRALVGRESNEDWFFPAYLTRKNWLSG